MLNIKHSDIVSGIEKSNKEGRPEKEGLDETYNILLNQLKTETAKKDVDNEFDHKIKKQQKRTNAVSSQSNNQTKHKLSINNRNKKTQETEKQTQQLEMS